MIEWQMAVADERKSRDVPNDDLRWFISDF